MATKQNEGTKKMHEATAHDHTVKPEDFLKITELKPKQKFTDLDSGEEKELEVKSQRFELAPFDSKKHGTKEQYFQNALAVAASLVQPISEQVEAFLRYATSASYQDGKKAALAGGNFLSPEVKSKISQYMGNLTAFSELTAKERFEKWQAGYKEKKPGAVKILEAVTASEDVFSDLL